MRFKSGESEFGKIIGDTHGGNVIRRDTCTGELIFVSAAFNPLTSAQLKTIAFEMENYENALPKAKELIKQYEELTEAQRKYSLRNWSRTGWTETL